MEKDAKRIPLRIQKKILQLTRVFFAVFILTVLFGVSNCSEAWAKDHWFHHDSCWAQGTSLRCTTCGALLGNAIDQITSTTFYCGDTINVLVGGDSGFTHRFTFHNADYSKMMTPSMYSKGTRYLNHESGRQSRSFGPINTSWSGNWTMYNQFSDTTYYPGKDKGGGYWNGTITVHHAWSGWIRTANPTCTAQGSEYRTCSGCGEREVRAVAALGHAWSAKIDRGDGYSDQRCSRCGAITNRTANTYYVAYNGNGATGGSTAKSTHTYDAAKTLTANGFTRTGYLFNGWTSSANGSGTKYSNQQSVKNLAKNNGATVNLYAQWTPVNYTVIYNGNGNAGGSTASSSHTYNVAKNLTKNGFTPKPGYHFSGWTANANGSGTKYNDQQSVMNLTTANGGKINLYAKWELNPFTVRFDGNGADSGTMNDQAFIYGSKQELSRNQFTREYYEFLGWSTDPNATEPTILDGADGSTLTTENGGIVTLYAVWKLSTVDITFHDQGGAGGPGTVTWLIGSEQIPSIPSKDGNAFLEWNSKPDGTGVSWPKDNLVPTGYPDFYALWMPEVYTAVYEPNEGMNPGHSYRTATLLPGSEINRIFKELAGTPENIFYIREAPRCIASGSYSIAENGAVRAYFRGNTIFIYSDAVQVQMNPDSAGMLAGLPNLKDIGTVKTWDAIHATDMEGFFKGDTSLTTLDLTTWRTPNVENMASMFEGCPALTAIHVDGNNWNTDSVGDYDKGANVFAGCTSLPGYDSAKTDITHATTAGYLTETETILDWDIPVKNIQKIESAAETTLNKNTYSRIGYQFAGWSLDRNDNTVDFKDQEKLL